MPVHFAQLDDVYIAVSDAKTEAEVRTKVAQKLVVTTFPDTDAAERKFPELKRQNLTRLVRMLD